MILVDWEISDYIKRGYITIDPYDSALLQPNSLDIRLGNHFVWYNTCNEIIDPYKKDTIQSNTNECKCDYFDIAPGQFVLAETLETVTLPDNVVSSIEGKSSIARLGIELHQTGGWIDAGFSGTITLEMHNSNCRPVRVYSGMPISQLVFYTTQRCACPYDKKPDAKYQHQKNATLSRYDKNMHKNVD
ncbi:MAG TPA: dCTP deaminase [Methanocorpusculum sp.]|nr:dCTP deaminase [Methanocorpusculum sp.]